MKIELRKKMSPTKETLHQLIDIIDNRETAFLYQLLMRFIPSDKPLPDELELIAEIEAEKANGTYQTFNLSEIDLDNLDKYAD